MTQRPTTQKEYGTYDGDESEAENHQQPRIDTGDAFDILGTERRRTIVEALDREPTWTLSDLAEHVAAVENDCARQRVKSKQRKRVYVALYQTHLDKLDDACVLAFEDDRIEANPEVVAAYRRILQYARDQDVGGDEEGDDRDEPGMIASVLGGIRG